MARFTLTIDNVSFAGPISPYETVLNPNALAFTAHLARLFTPRVQELLAKRAERQKQFDAGVKPDFLPETRAVRQGNWKVNPMPADLLDRRVEITGPTDAKMVINALNSGANTFMADLEDSNCPTWHNMAQGQVNLYHAVRRTLTFDDSRSGKHYSLGNNLAVLLVRPRGWHLWEKHMIVDGTPVPGGIFDFAVYFYNNAAELLKRGSGPYFYLPKMQSHEECRLWNDIFVEAQRHLGIPRGTIKATCLIETLPAVFEMHEFLYELREHSAGLNAGRWDYLFSFIKTQRENPAAVLPDRGLVTMEAPFMRAYTQLLIQTCHAHGAHAMGGMAAQIPIKNDEAANRAVMDKVRGDKLREVKDGHDGTWVAHPGLIPIARRVFDENMPGPNQLHRLREDVCVTAKDLLAVPHGPKTLGTLRMNINVSVQYMAAWLSGNGCVPLHNLMEDAATAEISRVQAWQWIRHAVPLDDGAPVTVERLSREVERELQVIKQAVGDMAYARGKYLEAAYLFKFMATTTTLEDFLTLPAYDVLLATEFGVAGTAGGAAARL